jgi:hypothetical protein
MKERERGTVKIVDYECVSDDLLEIANAIEEHGHVVVELISGGHINCRLGTTEISPNRISVEDGERECAILSDDIFTHHRPTNIS